MNLVERIVKLEKAVKRLLTRTSIYYNKGTYAPTYLGGTTNGVTTYSVQDGAWTRIGPIIIARGTLVWTAATGTGAALLGLPFTASASGVNNVAAYVRTVNVTFANGSVQGQIAAATSYIQMISPATNAAGTNVAIEAAGNIIFTAVYVID